MKINLGCGPHVLEGWMNLDLEAHHGVTKVDLSLGQIPAAANSADFIYSEHFIEHITREQSCTLMKSAFRVLKIGGVIRISTPDLDTIVQDYLDEKIDRWSPTWNPRTPCEMVNQGLRLWSHLFVYNAPELISLLSEAGFNGFSIKDWRESDHAELKNLEVRPYCGDLILEATK